MEITYRNVIITTFTQRAMLPKVMDNETEALKAAINSLGKKNIDKIKIMKIKNSLDIREVKASKNLLSELEISNGLILESPQEILTVYYTCYLG